MTKELSLIEEITITDSGKTMMIKMMLLCDFQLDDFILF